MRSRSIQIAYPIYLPASLTYYIFLLSTQLLTMSSNLSSRIPASINPVCTAFNPVTGGGLGYNRDQMMYRCEYGETGKLTHYNYSRWKRDIEFFLQA